MRVSQLTVRVYYSGVERRGASASNPFSMKPGVDACVRSHNALHERQRPVSLKMNWKPTRRSVPLRAAPL